MVSFLSIATVEDEGVLYLGTGRPMGQLMVRPALEAVVGRHRLPGSAGNSWRGAPAEAAAFAAAVAALDK